MQLRKKYFYFHYLFTTAEKPNAWQYKWRENLKLICLSSQRGISSYTALYFKIFERPCTESFGKITLKMFK